MSVPAAAHVVTRSHSLWRDVGKLLRLRILIFTNGYRHARLGRKIAYGFLILLVLAAFVGIYALSWLILSALRSPEAALYADPAVLVTGVPVVILSSAFGVILFTSFGVLLQALYLAGDMDFLLSAPLSVRAVFLSKLLQAILPNFALVSLFGLPVLYGLGTAGGYSLLYYPMVVLVLGAVALAAAGLAGLLVLVIVRFFPARRVAEVLGLVGGIVSILCSQSGQFARFSQVSSARVFQTLQVLTRLDAAWSPLAWAGRGIVAVGEGQWMSAVVFLALTVTLSALSLIAALVASERLYYSGWARVQVGGHRRKTVHRAVIAASTTAPAAAPSRALRLLPAPVRGLIAKDLLVLRRDLRNMSQLITPLILGVIYALALLRSGGQPPAGRGEAPQWFMNILGNAWNYGNVAIALFVSWSMLSRLALMGFSQEGQRYWLVKCAPVNANGLLAAKFLVAYLPALALGWVFTAAVAIIREGGLLALPFDLAVVALCLAGVCGLNLAFGVAGANLEWEDPRQMVRGATGCLSALATVAFMVCSLGLFFVPALVFPPLGWSGVLGQIVGLLAGGGFSLCCVFFALRLVRSRVPRLGE